MLYAKDAFNQSFLQALRGHPASQFVAPEPSSGHELVLQAQSRALRRSSQQHPTVEKGYANDIIAPEPARRSNEADFPKERWRR